MQCLIYIPKCDQTCGGIKGAGLGTNVSTSHGQSNQLFPSSFKAICSLMADFRGCQKSRYVQLHMFLFHIPQIVGWENRIPKIHHVTWLSAVDDQHR